MAFGWWSYWAIGLLFSTLGNSGENGPLSTGVDIFGDEKSRDEKDMSMLTIRAVEDPRTLDKILHVRPPANMRSFGQLLHLLEKKTGRTFERHYVTEQELAKKIQEAPFPLNFQLAMVHSTLVHGGAGERAVDPAVDVEATQLYPNIQFATVEECLDGLLL
uniref:NmrA-like domain-containing protein n=1 Tax=Aegilops tauschii TaxID=37682 RepID=N1R014_AEGTA